MKRRKLLSGFGIALAGSLAGCGGSGGDGGSEATPAQSDDTETPAATATEMQETEMESATETPAETPTPTPEPAAGNTHEIGEEFTVGEEGNALTYRILELFRSDRIGSNANNTTADGTFLIVIMELTNPQSGSVSFPRGVFRIQRENSWSRFAREGTTRIDADERLNVNQIGDATINGGNTQTGAVAFDVDPDRSYRIWITPTGDAETPEHFVPVGEVTSVEELRGSLTG